MREAKFVGLGSVAPYCGAQYREKGVKDRFTGEGGKLNCCVSLSEKQTLQLADFPIQRATTNAAAREWTHQVFTIIYASL